MQAESLQRARIGLAFAALLGIAIAFAILFQAGCAGDTKGGSVGDPFRALQLENLSLIPFLLGITCAAFAIGVSSAPDYRGRVPLALGFLVIGGLCLWVGGIQIEMWGVQSCFRP